VDTWTAPYDAVSLTIFANDKSTIKLIVGWTRRFFWIRTTSVWRWYSTSKIYVSFIQFIVLNLMKVWITNGLT